MTKKEYIEWIEEMENKGLDDVEIESIVDDYLDQPENPAWFFEEENVP